MQQVVQGALSFLGLNGQSSNTTSHLFDTLGLETVSRPLSLPTHNDVSLLDASLLAWLSLLQRERGEDDRVENFNWGRRTADGAETSSQFSVKAVLRSEGLNQTASVKNVLEALKKVTGQDETEENRTLFFNDGKEAPEKIKEEGYETAQRPNWKFQLELLPSEDAEQHDFTLQAYWFKNVPDALTSSQVTIRLNAFTELLGLILSSPETTSISSLLAPLPCDLNQIWAFNAVVPPLIDRTMQDIISEQAAANPSKPAVSSWDGEFTYAEVESKSDLLARHLVSRGVKLGGVVPLMFEKSRWTIVALLAVMKAGSAFALTDPTSQPEGRLRVMVEQTGGDIIVASASQTELAQVCLPSSSGGSKGQVITVSDELFTTLSQTPEPTSVTLPVIPTETTPLYIQFTSGSTGKPKGVVISHANYTSGALPRAEAVGYKSSSRCFEFASYAFDVSIDCMLCTLAVGGTICIPSDADRMNDLGGAILKSGANMAHMTPSVARVLDPEVIKGLDVLGLGGEAVSAADAAAWSRGKTSVIVAYGPSECTVGCTVNNVFARDEEAKKKGFTTGNIGTGVGGCGWVVDPNDHDRLVPVGAVGELLMEGPVVGLGYLGEEEKTKEVFIEDPKWLVAGHGDAHPGRKGRLYKTGDLVRYDADGSGAFVFVGRKDAQVKLRGQRVELVEIEHHLRAKLPSGVKIAAEVIKPSGGDPTLVAFLAETSSTGISAKDALQSVVDGEVCFSPELQAALDGIEEVLGVDLPRYMVPNAYIPLREMPSLVSGKIDRKTLRAMGAAMTREQVSGSAKRARQGGEGGAPTTEMEIALHKVWKQLLGTEQEIAAGDSFFAVGGDSLRAMRLIAAARAEGVKLTVADVFRYPVLRDMAVVATKVDTQDADGKDNNEVAPFSLLESDWAVEDVKAEASKHCNIDKDAVEDVYPCTPLQEALMALSAKVKEAYVAQRVLKMEGQAAADKLKAAFEAINADCAILRTRIIHSPRGLMQVVVKEPLHWHSAPTLAEYLETDRNEEMDLGKPLVRYGLIQDGDAYHFVLTMHHALYDGWSMPLVVDRVNQAYQGLVPRKPAAEFKHFINYLNNTLDRTACDAYWKGQLAGATGVQFPALPFEGYQTRADSLWELYVSLDGRKPPSSPNTTITLATIVRAAWALVASQYTAGNNDIVFGETLTGRNAPIVGADEIEGPMITTVPVRVCIDREQTVAEYLQQVAEQMITQIPYEHAGLQHIRRLSDDALQACELRTGLVLHPAAGEVGVTENTPANGLVPAGDSEAAQEALKFNTYALMLVCSLEADGFLVMASFDSKTVEMDVVKKALDQLQVVVRQLCEEGSGEKKVGQLACLTEKDQEEVKKLAGVKNLTAESDPVVEGITEEDVEGVWIVDAADVGRLVPVGAAGELIVETSKELPAPATLLAEKPAWYEGSKKLYKTGQLAKFKVDGESASLCILKATEPKTEVAKKKVSSSVAPSAVAATSAKQKTLRKIWAKLLKVKEDSIFLGDSFFNRGGDSITAMKLVSEARQQGLKISVAQVFANRTLFDMANVMQTTGAVVDALEKVETEYKPFSLIEENNKASIMEVAKNSLTDKSWTIADILSTRPLQEIAVRGTVELPRFSLRYELMHFNGQVDKAALFRACHEVVARNEILRTVFVRDASNTCYGVVIDNLITSITEYEIDDHADVKDFAAQVCRLDSQTRMPHGSSFVKWFFITNGTSQCTLAFRLSHAQYDEICLPIMLHQFHQLYLSSPESSIPPSYPFSHFVAHTLRDSIPAAIPYWRNLLSGSSGITKFRPSTPITSRKHFAIHRAVDISSRSRDVTIATLPSAAWALALARHVKSPDVLFGEVSSGRSVDVPGIQDTNAVTGPTWQYVPARIQFNNPSKPLRTGHDLLVEMQTQHMASSAYDCMGLEEIVKTCTDWKYEKDMWFDTVVHQDVAHVEKLEFSVSGDVDGGEKDKGGRGAKAEFETMYCYEEPLREWKVQAFRDEKGEEMVLEIVTMECWKEEAEVVLGEVCEALKQLVERPWEELDVARLEE
ncbi:non-ribosomal peptide synthetase [Neurospora intermedia]|uniref:Non-ribosomal peptide synthetase n=1 Tax=Neurospora intermedia TaxID=5142 RepID=A0ABR3DEV2_NEUIN